MKMGPCHFIMHILCPEAFLSPMSHLSPWLLTTGFISCFQPSAHCLTLPSGFLISHIHPTLQTRCRYGTMAGHQSSEPAPEVMPTLRKLFRTHSPLGLPRPAPASAEHWENRPWVCEEHRPALRFPSGLSHCPQPARRISRKHHLLGHFFLLCLDWAHLLKISWE